MDVFYSTFEYFTSLLKLRRVGNPPPPPFNNGSDSSECMTSTGEYVQAFVLSVRPCVRTPKRSYLVYVQFSKHYVIVLHMSIKVTARLFTDITGH